MIKTKSETKDIEDITKDKEKLVVKKETKFNLKEICNNSNKLLGVYPEIVYAAIGDNPKNEYTISEIKQLVNKFLKKEVK